MLQEIRGSGTLAHTRNKNKTRIHTRTKQKQNQIHAKLLQKVRGSGPLTHGQKGEIYNGTSTNITLSSTKNTVGQELRTSITV